ncbi:MAG: FAD-dependent oxidoreductase, partial [Gammaproteobacteria bacterium]
DYRHLLSPGRIGSLELRNRMFMSPMGSNLAEDDGSCGERIVRYYEARAKGGAALVTMGSVGVAYPRGSGNARQVAISEDRFIKPLSRVVDAVHSHGCKIALQLQHAGAISVNEPLRGFPFLVPSLPKEKPYDWQQDLTPEENRDMFEALFANPDAKFEFKVADDEDIRWLIGMFAKAAVRAREAGVDGVEIHAGHGYIISSFLSPSSNQRTDEYGGSIENRARLLVEVIRAIKKEAGEDYPVWFRLDSEEYLKQDGITLDDAITAAKMGEAAGADAVHVTAYADASRGISFSEAHAVIEPCKFVSNAKAIKAAVNMPVIGVGRIEPEVADKLIERGEIDFLAMARKILADPALPKKLKAGRPDLIRPCIYCYTCISQIFLATHIRCAVNAQTGFEAEKPIESAGDKKRILVVGGGPAGMEVARVATLRGHQVQLHEASSRLGGTVFFSSIVYPENGRLIKYLGRQMNELSVDVHLNSRVTAGLVRSAGVDEVVVATGARRNLVELPGSDLPHVMSGDEMREMVTGAFGDAVASKMSPLTKLMIRSGKLSGILNSAATIRRLSKYWLPIGERVLVYGGGLVGVELAEFLAERGRTVTVLEPGVSFGKELPLVRRWRLMDTLRKENVRLLPSAELLEIESRHVRYRTESGQEQRRRADSVIMALGAEPDASLVKQLETVCDSVHCVGDAQELGYIDGAINNGNRLAREL